MLVSVVFAAASPQKQTRALGGCGRIQGRQSPRLWSERTGVAGTRSGPWVFPQEQNWWGFWICLWPSERRLDQVSDMQWSGPLSPWWALYDSGPRPQDWGVGGLAWAPSSRATSGHLNSDSVLKVSCTLKNHERKWWNTFLRMPKTSRLCKLSSVIVGKRALVPSLARQPVFLRLGRTLIRSCITRGQGSCGSPVRWLCGLPSLARPARCWSGWAGSWAADAHHSHGDQPFFIGIK